MRTNTTIGLVLKYHFFTFLSMKMTLVKEKASNK